MPMIRRASTKDAPPFVTAGNALRMSWLRSTACTPTFATATASWMISGISVWPYGRPSAGGARSCASGCAVSRAARSALRRATTQAFGWHQPVKGGSIDPAVLFIDRCLQLLKPGGRLLIVLPDGILCNSGDRYVREYIMGKKDEQTGQFVGGKAIVKAVISLPADTFKFSGTGAKTSILYPVVQ